MKFAHDRQGGRAGRAPRCSPAAQAQRATGTPSVVETDGGHRIGNPDGQGQAGRIHQLHLPALRRVRARGRAAIKLGYVMPGNVSVEIRHLIRDPVDLTVGDAGQLRRRRQVPAQPCDFMLGQAKWIAPLAAPTAAQQARWRRRRRRRPPRDRQRLRLLRDHGAARLQPHRGRPLPRRRGGGHALRRAVARRNGTGPASTARRASRSTAWSCPARTPGPRSSASSRSSSSRPSVKHA